MSRSYKKAIFKSKNCKKLDKRLAAKAVRNTLDIPDGSWYKRVYSSYDINDYVNIMVFEKELEERGACWTRNGWYVSK